MGNEAYEKLRLVTIIPVNEALNCNEKQTVFILAYY
jgi:hypothetical protein